jgi:hypothetical protein
MRGDAVARQKRSRDRTVAIGRETHSDPASGDCCFNDASLDAAFAGAPRPPPEQPRGHVGSDRCFAWRSDAVTQRPTRAWALGLMPSTAEASGGCSGLTARATAFMVSPKGKARAPCYGTLSTNLARAATATFVCTTGRAVLLVCTTDSPGGLALRVRRLSSTSGTVRCCARTTAARGIKTSQRSR